MEIKKYSKIGILIIGILLLIGNVFAFGVGSAYHDKHPLEISAGETKLIIFNLQNMPGPEDISLKPEITEGGEIMQLIDDKDISVPVGASIDITAKVIIPIDAKIGEVYPIGITFTTISKSESGAFGLGGSVGKSFNVVIIPTAEQAARAKELKSLSSKIVYWIIGIVVLITIIFLIRAFLKKRKGI